jgi:hypothetical protein
MRSGDFMLIPGSCFEAYSTGLPHTQPHSCFVVRTSLLTSIPWVKLGYHVVSWSVTFLITQGTASYVNILAALRSFVPCMEIAQISPGGLQHRYYKDNAAVHSAFPARAKDDAVDIHIRLTTRQSGLQNKLA